jgi:hypothetical protein
MFALQGLSRLGILTVAGLLLACDHSHAGIIVPRYRAFGHNRPAYYGFSYGGFGYYGRPFGYGFVSPGFGWFVSPPYGIPYGLSFGVYGPAYGALTDAGNNSLFGGNVPMIPGMGFPSGAIPGSPSRNPPTSTESNYPPSQPSPSPSSVPQQSAPSSARRSKRSNAEGR